MQGTAAFHDRYRPIDSSDPSESDTRTRLFKPGDHVVDVPITCVITRFGLRSPHQLLPMYLDYRRIARYARKTPGLLRTAFLIERPTVCYTFSIWASHISMPRFGTNVPSHVDVARKSFGRVSFKAGRGPEIWSTKWELTYVSNNLNWDDFDLRDLVFRMEAERKSHA